MSLFTYPENKKINIIQHLDEIRRRVLICLGVVFLFTILSFFKMDVIMKYVVEPIQGLVDQLIFISPTEGFISYFKVAFLLGFLFSFPIILFQLWAFSAPAFAKNKRSRIFLWLVFSFFLFFSGVCFSYFIAVPRALFFLLSFDAYAVPMITLGKYVSFFTALIFVGAFIFEIPVIMGLLTDLGIVSPKLLREKRQYAVVAILILAAIITPTHDIANLLIFAIPMMVLYECGVHLSWFVEKRRKSSNLLF